MEFKVKQEVLSRTLSKFQSVIEKQSTLFSYTTIFIEVTKKKVKFSGTNMRESLTDVISADVKKEGKVAVSFRNLYDVVKELPSGDVSLKKKSNGWVCVEKGKAVFNIVGINEEEFPKIPKFKGQKVIKMEGRELLDMIQKVSYAMSVDDVEKQYHLSGVFFNTQKGGESCFMVATDGHRLSYIQKGKGDEKPAEGGVIIPRKGIYEMRRLLEVEEGREVSLSKSKEQISLEAGDSCLIVKLAEGGFPNYQGFLSKELDKKMFLNTKEFLSCLKRVSVLSNAKFKGIALEIGKKGLIIKSSSSDVGNATEVLPAEFSGKSMEISLNAKYLMDILSTIDSKMTQVSFKDQVSVVELSPKESGEKYLGLVMPMYS